MPVLGKGAVLRHLRKNGSRIPVVVISGVEQRCLAPELDALQAAYLSKDQLNLAKFEKAITHALALSGWMARLSNTG